MRLTIRSLLRRARRVKNPFLVPFTQYLWSSTPPKHVKIDDEEQQFGDSPYSMPFSPSVTTARILRMFLLSLFFLVALILFLAYTIYKPPSPVIRFLQWKYPDVLFHAPLLGTQRVVALTLDDAPSDETAKILDILKTYEAKATFFVIGKQVSSHPHLLQRMHDEGHELGNHAWADEPSIKLPLSELERQVKEVEALLPPNAHGAKYFRPGSGFFNKKLVDRVRSLGYRVVLGSIYPHDPQIPNPRVNARHVLRMVKPGGIIIMHDRRSYSAEQLELVLKGLAAKSWKVESIGGLLRIADSRGKKGG